MHVCWACSWGTIACSPECRDACRAQARAASLRTYWHSDLGLETTRERVAEWRRKKRETQNVTHSSAEEVGPSAIVDSLAPPAPVAKTEPEVAASEETTDEQRRDGGRVAAERAAPPGDGGHETEAGHDTADHAGSAAVSAVSEGARCARCGRQGVVGIVDLGDDTGTPRERRETRPRSPPCPMSSTPMETAKPCPLATIGTTLSRARCRQPARIDRMKHSLTVHGQLTPLVAVATSEGVELVDGFKRHAAARLLGWETLTLSIQPLDETGRWAAMLLLNRGPTSMTTLEEALVLREIQKTGLTQVEIGSLCARHKTWVSRRIGLAERLHPELVEAMKVGLLHPGSARRLLSLPPGNQLEFSAAIQTASLGPRDTELLVTLWHRTKEPAARRALLTTPRASLAKHHPETRRAPMDPRLATEGRRLLSCLHRFEAAMMETSRGLRAALPPKDRAILDKDLRRVGKAASEIATELGRERSASAENVSEGSAEIS